MYHLNADVIITGRDKTKADQFLSSLPEKENKIEFIQSDFSDLNNVTLLQQKLIQKYPKIDILINNAGLCSKDFKQTPQGLELMMGVNHMAHFQLTSHLLPLLQLADEIPRVINVASRAHVHGGQMFKNDLPPVFEDFFLKEPQNQAEYSWGLQYGRTKLANIHFTRALHHYCEKNDIPLLTTSLHPGAITTDFQRELIPDDSFVGKYKDWILPIANFFFKTSSEGAQTTLHCALAPVAELNSGKYYFDCEEKETSAGANSWENVQTNWRLSQEQMMKSFGIEASCYNGFGMKDSDWQ